MITENYITLYESEQQRSIVESHANEALAIMHAEKLLQEDSKNTVYVARVEAKYTTRIVVEKEVVQPVNGTH